MLFFTFLKEKKRNATGTTTCSAERAIRPSVVVRKVTYGEPVNDRGQGACSADEYKGDVQAAKGGGLLL
ncbi:hypothetical protein Ngar_c09450 [Candidatus Nitrososphaera gargensis Ga9.2]|uniref:Uncharacterized protein n=2 Tax=Candidatus Nitrososphaera gargensis TaxID=497727 RepID=K0III7_NITGG|nr:hypothetical protein Ngar_c09450 [Candidatus Nitrososphaera gargensis Ga9.2]